MLCFHLFWLENAGWTGAFGAGAAFWEPEEERNVENQIQIQIQCSVKKYKYWEPGKLVERLVCSFLISSSMETARTWHICSFFVGRKHGSVIIQSYLWLWVWDTPQKSLTLTKKSLTHQKKVSLTKKKFDSQKKVWRTKTSLTHLRVKCEELSDSKLLHLQTIYWQKKIDKEYHVWLSSYFYFYFICFLRAIGFVPEIHELWENVVIDWLWKLKRSW